MSQLETTYLGLKLKNPVIVGSSSLTSSVEKIKEIEQGSDDLIDELLTGKKLDYFVFKSKHKKKSARILANQNPPIHIKKMI